MDGIIANLPAICDLADRYGALVMVDDSHAVGFVGEHGRGTPEHCGVDGPGRHHHRHARQGARRRVGRLHLRRKREVVDWLRQRSRPYLFSNTLAPAIAAASLRVLDLLEQRRRAARAARRATPTRFRAEHDASSASRSPAPAIRSSR